MRRRPLSDKRNDLIAGNDIALYGEKIIVSPLKQSNVECYLSTYKRASAFSKSRLAEKLGGVVVKGKTLIVEAMHEAGFQMDSVDDKEIPKMVT